MISGGISGSLRHESNSKPKLKMGREGLPPKMGRGDQLHHLTACRPEEGKKDFPSENGQGRQIFDINIQLPKIWSTGGASDDFKLTAS
jgi:hypothetical protein